jgi:hypothetical protein
VLSVTYAPAAADEANYASATLQRTVTVSAASFVAAVSLAVEGHPTYSTAGGSKTFRIRVAYPGQALTALGMSVNLPAGWSFVSSAGPTAVVSPGVGDAVLEWVFSPIPVDVLELTFTASYPAGLAAPQTLSGFVVYRPATAEVLFPDLVLPAMAPPVVAVSPVARVVGVQTGTVFTVVASGAGPLTYQWRREGVVLSDGGGISGATTAALAIAGVQLADAGSYRVTVANPAGEVISDPAALTVVDAVPTHSWQRAGEATGGLVTIAHRLTYAGSAAGLGWQLLLPEGWTYAGGGGSEGDVRPVVGTPNLLEWAWTSIPPSPVTFTTTLLVPPGSTGVSALAALAIFRVPAGYASILVRPDPLLISTASTHSADTNRDFQISLVELTRVIELYNTRHGATRSGSYALAATFTEDGFVADGQRALAAVVALGRYHSADTNRDGKLGLFELTRVIELYNTRSGGSRTGQYKPKSGSEDGFDPGP